MVFETTKIYIIIKTIIVMNKKYNFTVHKIIIIMPLKNQWQKKLIFCQENSFTNGPRKCANGVP